ncbi:hypothetical protein IJ674_08875 [bacterium]|nr:hypothetical protein [bacterium]
MSLSVSPVSSVSFRAQESVQPSAEDILSRPGAFAKPETTYTQPAKKKHTFLKYVAGALITAGVLAGALYGLKRGFPNVFKVTEDISKLEGGVLKKTQAYITTGVAKGAEYVEKCADKVVNYSTKGWDKLKGLFKSTKPDA